MAVRSGPSREARLVGGMGTGDEVIVDEVRADGWVRLSPTLDAYAGYERYDALRQPMWMLTAADDVGELLREVVLDERGGSIDDDDWLPELV